MPKKQPVLDPRDPFERFALELRRLRMRAGEPSHAELARAMYCSRPVVTALLNGKRLPSARQLDAFVRVCHGDLSEWRNRLIETRERIGHGDIAGEVIRMYADERIDILQRARTGAAAAHEGKRLGGQEASSPRTLDMPLAIPEGFRPPVLSLGLLGASGSGKTMYLAALDVATARAAGGWSIAGADERSEELLAAWTTSLVGDKRFPDATVLCMFEQFRWILAHPDGIRLGERQSQAGALSPEIELDLVDAAGEWGSAAAPPHVSNAVIDHLTQCGGLLLLFDLLMADHGINHHYLQQYLQRLASRYNGAASPLPHYVAVCVTKFDDPAVFQEAVLGGYTRTDGTTMSLPVVPDQQACSFFRDICSRYADAELFMALLHLYFQPERIRYFVISSLGFYISPETMKFDISDFRNIVQNVNPGYSERRIRGDIYPVKTLDPILWIAENASAGNRADTDFEEQPRPRRPVRQSDVHYPTAGRPPVAEYRASRLPRFDRDKQSENPPSEEDHPLPVRPPGARDRPSSLRQLDGDKQPGDRPDEEPS